MRSVGVRSSVGHGKDSRSSVLELEVFVGELSSVDGLSSSTCFYDHSAFAINGMKLLVLAFAKYRKDRLYRSSNRRPKRKKKLTIVVGEVTTLAHETRDDTMEGRLSKSESLFTSTETTEIFSRLGGDIGTKFHCDTSRWLSTNGHIEVYLRIRPVVNRISRRNKISMVREKKA